MGVSSCERCGFEAATPPGAAEVVLDFRRLSKRYGEVVALEDLSLQVCRGEVFGFLGPNGAGKSTTTRLLVGLLRPSGGGVSVFGHDAWRQSRAVRARLGYLPGELALYEDLTGAQLMRFFHRIRGRADAAAAFGFAASLRIDLSRRIRTLSKGNKQKLGLLLALAHEPELLVLDEPTAGLDPLMQETVHDLLRKARAAGTTVFLSSHILAEVEELCDRVAMIRAGRLLTVDSVQNLKRNAVHRLEFVFQDAVEPEEFASLPGVLSSVRQDGLIRVQLRGLPDAVLKVAARHTVSRVMAQEADLDEIFRSYYQEAGA